MMLNPAVLSDIKPLFIPHVTKRYVQSIPNVYSFIGTLVNEFSRKNRKANRAIQAILSCVSNCVHTADAIKLEYISSLQAELIGKQCQ